MFVTLYNQNIKKSYLSTLELEDEISVSYIFSKFSDTEIKLNKDIFEMSFKELENLFLGETDVRDKIRMITGYIEWCVANGYRQEKI